MHTQIASGTDRAAAPRRTAPDIVEWLTTEIAKLVGLPRESIGVDVPIVDYLRDSRDAVSLAADLEDWLGAEMSASIVWDHPTIAALAEHIAGEVVGRA